jgi:hypothetical protein
MGIDRQAVQVSNGLTHGAFDGGTRLPGCQEQRLVVVDAPLVKHVGIRAHCVSSTLRVDARQPQVPVDVQAHQIAGGFEPLTPGLGDRVGEEELHHHIVVSISLFLGQSFHQFVTRLSSQTLA